MLSPTGEMGVGQGVGSLTFSEKNKTQILPPPPPLGRVEVANKSAMYVPLTFHSATSHKCGKFISTPSGYFSRWRSYFQATSFPGPFPHYLGREKPWEQD